MALDLHIGQVLYIVSDKSTKVVPVVVSEQAVVKTLDGNTITWKVIIGPKEKRKSINLDKINGEKFNSLLEAKHMLIKRFEMFLDETTTETEKNVKNWYGVDIDKASSKPSPKQEEESAFDAESLIDSLEKEPDNMDPYISNKTNDVRLTRTDSPETRQAKMRAMISPAPEDMIEEMNHHIDESNDEEVPEGVRMVTTPDGQKIPVIIGD